MKNIPVELTRKEIHQKLKDFFGVIPFTVNME